MFCENCGTKLPDGSRFCTSCGAKIGTQPVGAAAQSASPLPPPPPAFTPAARAVPPPPPPAYTPAARAVTPPPPAPAAQQPASSSPQMISYTPPPAQSYGTQTAPGYAVQAQPPSEPLSLGDYIKMFLLMFIPFLNLVLLFIWGFSAGSNLNRKNLARAILIMAVISIIFYALVGGAIMRSLMGGLYY